MSVVSDCYMNMILPEDISLRIRNFVMGEQDFPYIKESELACILYVYGKYHKVKTEWGVKEAVDIAERTAANFAKEIEYYNNSMTRFDSEVIKSKYIRRELQILQDHHNSKPQIWNDPTILSDSFARHISFYRQEYFFQVYGPLKDSELLMDIREDLVDRIVMIGFNRKDESAIPFQHPMIPAYIWFRDNIKHK
jgi:hypothetical protein